MSPRRSSTKAARTGGVRGPYRKPKADIYTVLLAIAVVAMLIACVLLYLETADYPDKPPWSGGPTGKAPQPQSVVLVATG